ncbi:replication initiator protein A [Faecalibacterium prausnitzii]
MPLPQYLPYARFLLDADLSHTAKMLYTLLLDRATLSQKNNWVDD